VSCAKTAEPIDMPFWMKTRVSPGNHLLDEGAYPPMGRDNFRGLSGPFKSIGMGATVAARENVKT